MTEIGQQYYDSMLLPDWNSVEAVSKFAKTCDALEIASLIVVLMAGVLSLILRRQQKLHHFLEVLSEIGFAIFLLFFYGGYRYGNREKELLRSDASAQKAKLSELQSQLAQANDDAKQAKQQASAISQDLVRGQHELAELRKKVVPRRITAGQRQVMIPVLKQLRGQAVAIACRMMDGESCDYGRDLITVFRGAGCAVPDIIKTSVNDFPGYVVLTKRGEADSNALRVVAEAFKVAGIRVRAEAVAENSVGMWYPNAVHVVIGRKAP